MLSILNCRQNLLRNRLAKEGLVACAAIFLLAASLGQAQDLVAAAQLPSAPEPQHPAAAPTALALLLDDTQRGGIGRSSTDMSPVGREPQDAPIVTMAPHPENSRYWVSGQANIIIQGNLPFHSLYQGTNSFLSGGAYKTSLLGTVYTALRPTHSIRYNTDLILDIESAGGRGLSQALGLAGAHKSGCGAQS